MSTEEKPLDTKQPSRRLDLTHEQFEAALKAAAEGGAKAALETMRGQIGIASEFQTIEERIYAALGKPMPDRRAITTWHQPCSSIRNGARFTAVIVESKAYPEGRTVNLIDYVYPDDIVERSRMPALDARGGFTPQFKLWRYQQYDLADRSAFVGQAARYLPVDGERVAVDLGETARTFGG